MEKKIATLISTLGRFNRAKKEVCHIHFKEHTHYSKRLGDVVPGVLVYLRHLYQHSSRVERVQWACK